MTSNVRRFAAVLFSLLVIGSVAATPASAGPIIDVLCVGGDKVENPHVSSVNYRKLGRTDIKVGGVVNCNPTDTPTTVTIHVELEKQGDFGFWHTVAVGREISKSIFNTPQRWDTGELFVIKECEPGWYRGRIVGKTDRLLSFSFGGVSREIYMDCKVKSTSLIIDDTGSMGGVIGSVKSALTAYISGQPSDDYTKWNLTTFKDSPRTVGSTEDRDEILGWVGALAASGGGDCPEDVLGGISSGLASLGTDPHADKQMIVATDASAQAGDVDGIIAQARAAGVKVNVLLTGDCDEPAGLVGKQGPVQRKLVAADPLSSQVVLKKIATATGGKYFFLPSGTTDDFTGALDEIFAAIATAPAPPSPSASARPSRPAASASPTQGGPALPVTGRNVVVLVVLAAALVAAGTVLSLRFRRRRLTE